MRDEIEEKGTADIMEASMDRMKEFSFSLGNREA